MKLPEKNTTINIDINILNTPSIVGCILLLSHILGYISGWGWIILYSLLLLLGYNKENKNDRSDG